MDSTDPHDRAAEAMRAAVAKAIRSLIAELDRRGRTHMRLSAMKVEGREQVALAASLREQAKRSGWA